ncbi:substrate-binding periplasmic protein [Leucobacter sp. GX24907]
MSLNTRNVRRLLALGGVATIAATGLAACSSAGGEDGAGGEECSPAHEFETLNEGVLAVSTYDIPPYVVIEEDGTLSGWEGELISKFAEENCLSLEVSAAGGAGAVVPSVETGRADVGIGAWYRTEARAEIVRLSYPTSLDRSGIVSLEGLSSEDLDGHKVGSQSGNLWNDSLQKKLGDDFAVYQDTEAEFSDLSAGRIDAVIETLAAISTRLDSKPIEGVEVVPVEPIDGVPEFDRPGQTTMLTALDNESIGEALDASIEAWHEDGSIAELFDKYGLDPESTEIEEVWNL